MKDGNYGGKGSYGKYWDSWKPTLVKWGIFAGIGVFALVTYGVVLARIIR